MLQLCKSLLAGIKTHLSIVLSKKTEFFFSVAKIINNFRKSSTYPQNFHSQPSKNSFPSIFTLQTTQNTPQLPVRTKIYSLFVMWYQFANHSVFYLPSLRVLYPFGMRPL